MSKKRVSKKYNITQRELHRYRIETRYIIKDLKDFRKNMREELRDIEYRVEQMLEQQQQLEYSAKELCNNLFDAEVSDFNAYYDPTNGKKIKQTDWEKYVDKQLGKQYKEKVIDVLYPKKN